MNHSDEITPGQALKVMQIAAIKDATCGNSSSKLAHRDAVCCYAKGDYKHARLRALASLAHSVGILNRSYIKALNA